VEASRMLYAVAEESSVQTTSKF